MAVIKDHKIQPQLDLSNIEKGFKKIESMFDKLNKLEAKVAGSGSKEKKKGQAEAERGIKEEIRLTRKRNQLRGSILRAEKLGLNVKKAENMLSSRNLDNISKVDALLNKEIKKRQRVNQRQDKERKASDLERKERVRFHSQEEKSQERLNRIVQKRKQMLLDMQAAMDIKMTRARRAGVSPTDPAFQRMAGQRGALGEMLTQVTGAGFNIAAVSKLDNSIKSLGRSSRKAADDLAHVSRELRKQNFLARATGDSIRNLARSYISAFAIVAGAIGTFRIGEQLEQIKSSLMAVSGSSEQVEKDWQFIQARALGLGQDLTTMSKGFQQITIAAKTMNFSMDDAKHIWMASAEAATAFNLTVDDSSGVMRFQ